MIRIACVDDNEIQLHGIASLLDAYSGERNLDLTVDSFSSPKKLLESARYDPYQIYILDIVMPEMNGLELAVTLRMLKDMGKIIFLTSTPDYAVASYDVDAFYYLLKPAEKDKIFSVLDRAIKSVAEAPTFEVKTKKGSVKMRLDDITYVDLVDRCLHFHLKDAPVAITPVLRSSFKEAIAPLLSRKGFILCSASKLVNMAYVDAMDAESILLRDGTVIYPSKSARPDLKAAFKLYRSGI